MSERNLGQLLDRAVEHAPTGGLSRDLGGEQMLAAGKRRVRQRRTVAAGTGIGALALAAAVWTSVGGSGLLSGPDTAPAGTTPTTVTTTADQDAPVVAGQDRTIQLRPEGEDSTYTFSDAMTSVGAVTVHLKADGSSTADVTVNGASTTVTGEPVIGGGATAYRGDAVTIVTFPLPEAGMTTAVLGVGEALSDDYRDGDQPMSYWAINHGPDTSPEAGLPREILLATPTSVTTLSGAAVDFGQVQGRDQLVWALADGSEWGLISDSGSASTTGEVMMTGDDTNITWAAKVPLAAKTVRLFDETTGADAAVAEWYVKVGDHIVAGAPSTWAEAEGMTVQWADESGLFTSLDNPSAQGSGDFAGITVELLRGPETSSSEPTVGLDYVPSYQGTPLTEVESSLTAGKVYPFPGRTDVQLVVLEPGMGGDTTLMTLEKQGSGYLPAPQHILDSQQVDATSASAAESIGWDPGILPTMLLQVPAGTFDPQDGDLIAFAHPQNLGGFNTWSVLGTADTNGVMAIDPGLAVAFAPDQGWILYPGSDHGDGSALLGGTVDQTMFEWVSPEDPERAEVVAVLTAGADAQLILPSGFRVEKTQTHDGPIEGYEVFTATVNRPVDGGAGGAYGLDLDGDGQVDAALPQAAG